MEKYNLHMRREVFDRVSKCMSAHIEADKWFPVKVLGDLMESDLSGIFGNGNLGWSPSTLLYYCQSAETTFSMCMSLPKPEEIPACPDVRTVREQMDDLANRERPTLEDWLSKNSISNGAQPFEKVCMQNALAILRRMNEDRRYVRSEVIETLIEMRTLIHALIGTDENCYDEAVRETAEAVRKTTRLDAMDALHYAIQALLDNKGKPWVKEAINSVYGSAMYEGTPLAGALKSSARESLARLNNAVNGGSEDANTGLSDPCERENVRFEEPNALFVTIETGMFEVTQENIEMVKSFILNAGEGRDIHLRII